MKLVAALVAVLVFITSIAHADPLPSWNDTAPKEAIVAFIEKVTTAGSPDYVVPAERIATFDNDGCLWCEQPMYVQAFFVFDSIKRMAPQHPEWKDQKPFASVLKGDMKTALAGGEKALVGMLMATHSGMTTDAFEKSVTDWLATAKHPKTGKPFTEMVYQPMLEWATSGKGARLGMIIHHTDAEREFAYDRESHVGKLDKGLDEAKDKGWVVMDMKSDWKVIYP